MSERFADYGSAINYAEHKANQTGGSFGIRRTKEYGQWGFNVARVPSDPAKRFGSDFTCEIVEPQHASVTALLDHDLA